MKRRKSGTKTVGINQEKSKDEGGGRGRALSVCLQNMHKDVGSTRKANIKVKEKLGAQVGAERKTVGSEKRNKATKYPALKHTTLKVSLSKCLYDTLHLFVIIHLWFFSIMCLLSPPTPNQSQQFPSLSLILPELSSC